MTAKAKNATPATSSPSLIVLFGIDSRGKPKGARFGRDLADLAIKAATQLQLRVLASNDPKVAELATRLPVGRVHATGRTFVPFIRRDLYDKLVAAAPNGNAHPASPPTSGSSGAPGSTSGGAPPNRPRNWHEIGLGDLVVAQQSPDDGWYEAIVIEANGDMLTLRWRDYPRESRIVRHRHRLGLLYPGPKPTTDTGKSAKTTAKQDKPAADNQGTDPKSLPRDWQEIGINHLVLAEDDGPWKSWWEATPVEKAGDGLRLRWRNRVNTSLFTRPRLALALICPDAT